MPWFCTFLHFHTRGIHLNTFFFPFKVIQSPLSPLPDPTSSSSSTNPSNYVARVKTGYSGSGRGQSCWQQTTSMGCWHIQLRRLCLLTWVAISARRRVPRNMPPSTSMWKVPKCFLVIKPFRDCVVILWERKRKERVRRLQGKVDKIYVCGCISRRRCLWLCPGQVQ